MKISRRCTEWLTVAEVCAEIKISRSTFYEWRAKGIAPESVKVPNGGLRVSRDALDAWWDARKDNAA